MKIDYKTKLKTQFGESRVVRYICGLIAARCVLFMCVCVCVCVCV